MNWRVQLDPGVENDLKQLGSSEARRALKAIREKLAEGEPDKIGKTLRKPLEGCRRIREGDIRIVYRILAQRRIWILCVGPRRDDEVYAIAKSRMLHG